MTNRLIQLNGVRVNTLSTVQTSGFAAAAGGTLRQTRRRRLKRSHRATLLVAACAVIAAAWVGAAAGSAALTPAHRAADSLLGAGPEARAGAGVAWYGATLLDPAARTPERQAWRPRIRL